ncbi:MAG: peptidoglycan bridge formation glycyltransferase FemA/FemB family protein [Candidatus Gracilibacteria bacterium]|jgi:lipid II:glycine glycyltransferase (peptidoglycan interpeptide bridge formation enzyme)
MYYCSHITKDLKEDFENLIKKNAASGFHQSFAWSKFKQAQGWDTYKIGLFSDKTKKLVGGCSVLEFCFSDGTSFLYIPEGPVLDYTDEDNLFWQWRAIETALHSIIALDPEKKTTHLRMEPRIDAVPKWFFTGFIKAPLNLQPRYTQTLDIEMSEDEMLAQMKPKGRYNIRLAQKKGVTVREISFDKIGDFYNVYKTTFERNKFEGKDLDFFHSYSKNCDEHSKVFVAEVEGKVLASAIIVYFGDRATYFYGASSNEMRDFMAPYALHWHIIKDAKSKGYKEYDFWGIAKDENDTKHDWHGLTKFKKQFGGKQLSFVGAYDYVFQQDLYKAFIKRHES